MSLLPDDMPVAWVNIPGSHDSSTSKKKMNMIANSVDAWVQTYSIMEQFEKGARYFDFRVGSELVRCWLGLGRRAMTKAERSEVKELQMYHGPLCTNTPFIGSMEELAQRIRKDGTEFVIINVQAEGESDGLWSSLNQEAKHMRYQCFQYYYDLEGKLHDEKWLRATFIEGWPDNRKGYATFYTYAKADSLLNDAYVQSYYEMKLHDKTKITAKEDAIKSLAAEVTSYNLDPSHTNVFGFSAMNANTGEPTSLKTYAFAHEYNGFAFEMYVSNMNGSGASAQPFHCGVVPMDHYGADVFTNNEKVKLYGDKLSWAVIESNFYNRDK